MVGDRQPLGEPHDRVLGHGVRQVAVRGEDAGHRGRVEQVARAALEHGGKHGAHRVHVGHQVDFPLVLPDGELGIEWIASRPDPCVAEEDVDRAVLVLGPGDQAVDVGLLPDVAGHREPADLAGDGCGSLGVPIRHDDPGPLLGKCPSRGRADAARRARDDADFPFEFHVSGYPRAMRTQHTTAQEPPYNSRACLPT